jgi:DNA-damage-inducible protein J
MSQATLSIRMDEDIKRRFDFFCADVGMNATVAVNMFARAVLREKRIPFKVASTDPFYSAKNQAILLKSMEQLERGEGTVHELIEDYDD